MNAIQTLLTDSLDIWSSAENEKKSGRGRASGNAGSVYGIRKLRELILELAVRGKLVPQDANDEPASALLKRIQAEKAKLIAEGKIRKDKLLPAITEEEKPFDLPHGWVCVRFSDYATDIATGPFGSMIHQSDYVQGGVPLINPSHMIGDKIIADERVSVSKAMAKTLDSYAVYEGDIVMARRGEVGRIALVTKNENGWLCGTGSFVLIFCTEVCRDYLRIFFRCSYARAYLAGEAVGTTMVNLNHGILKKMPMALPSIAEQHRIIAKVDELMALCDQLEARHGDAADAHDKLVSHLLATLTLSQNAEDFSANWQRIAAHFDTLFATEASIDALKQTLLQLAVMGKLVPQDANDEPANELLKRFGISSTASSLAGWSKVSLGELGNIYGGATPSKAKSEYWVGNIPWVSPKDMKRFYIDDAEDKVSEGAVRETSLKLIPAGSLLIVVRGMILAHSFPVALTIREVTINQDMKALVVPEAIKEYTLLYMRAMKNSFVALVDRSSHGTCKLISGKLWMAVVEIPPKAEQHRIVVKVDELMTLCDRLKSRITDASRLQQKLADVLAEQAVA